MKMKACTGGEGKTHVTTSFVQKVAGGKTSYGLSLRVRVTIENKKYIFLNPLLKSTSTRQADQILDHYLCALHDR